MGCCIAWKGVGAYTLLPTEWLREESHDKFDTTLITTETTPISLGLLKPKGVTYRTLLQ